MSPRAKRPNPALAALESALADAPSGRWPEWFCHVCDERFTRLAPAERHADASKHRRISLLCRQEAPVGLQPSPYRPDDPVPVYAVQQHTAWAGQHDVADNLGDLNTNVAKLRLSVEMAGDEVAGLNHRLAAVAEQMFAILQRAVGEVESSPPVAPPHDATEGRDSI